jgi:hypothetical protein
MGLVARCGLVCVTALCLSATTPLAEGAVKKKRAALQEWRKRGSRLTAS